MQSNINEFVKDVELVDVFLRSSRAESFAFPRSLDPSKLNLHYEFDTQFDNLKDAKVLLCFLELSVTGKESDSSEDQFAIEAQYVLAYKYDAFKGQTSKELFEAFTKRNALFNAYPFLRETITNLSIKMTLPPIIAPLLRLDNHGKVQPVDEAAPEKQTKSSAVKKKTKSKKKDSV